MSAAWQSFADEIARWRDAGRVADFWWRDDDAALPHPALARLLDLAARSRAPLALAVIPLHARAETEALRQMVPVAALPQQAADQQVQHAERHRQQQQQVVDEAHHGAGSAPAASAR